MASTSSVTFNPPLRDVRGRFARADKILLEEKRKSARLLGRRWVEIARDEAPSKTGKFRESIRFRTFVKPKEVGFTTSSAQPLGTFITLGTKPHRIAARKAKALVFFWGKVGKYTIVPKGGGFKTHVSGGKLWIGKGYVNHPGTKPNNYIERTYIRWERELNKEIARMSRSFIKTIIAKADK